MNDGTLCVRAVWCLSQTILRNSSTEVKAKYKGKEFFVVIKAKAKNGKSGENNFISFFFCSSFFIWINFSNDKTIIFLRRRILSVGWMKRGEFPFFCAIFVL